MDSITKVCRKCGQAFTITPEQAERFAEKNFELPERCPDCRKLKSRIIHIKCIDCGKEFAMDGLEVAWYSNFGYPLPKRCHSCRKQRKEYRQYLNSKMDPRD